MFSHRTSRQGLSTVLKVQFIVGLCLLLLAFLSFPAIAASPEYDEYGSSFKRFSGADREDVNEDESPTPVPSKTWYLAEGSTNGGFETWVSVQNPNDETAPVSLTYMTPGGAVPGPTAALVPQSRMTFNVADTVPNQWEVSTFVLSDLEVIAERSMFWGNRTGGHNSIGVNQPIEAWMLAEGSTNGGFETWVLVQNPNNSSTFVEVVYLTSQGPFLGPSAVVGPNSRVSFNAADYVPGMWDVSTVVQGDQPIVVERSVYYGNRTCGHNSIGASYVSQQWFLAEGSTNGGFETWILVANPGETDATVDLVYLTSDGAVEGPSYTLPPFSRQSFSVADTVPGEWGVSTVVQSNELVVAERAMYWAGRTGGHDSTGIILPSDKWYVAEGSTKGGFETWVLVQNPNGDEAEVQLTYMTPEGERKGPTVTIDPYSRMSFHVADSVPDTWEVSTLVESDSLVIVEKSIYWDNRVDGGCSIGVREPVEGLAGFGSRR